MHLSQHLLLNILTPFRALITRFIFGDYHIALEYTSKVSHIQFLETYRVEAAKPNLSGITVTCEESIQHRGVRMNHVLLHSPRLGEGHLVLTTEHCRINGEM